MCGIVGIFSKIGIVKEDVLMNAINVLRHRGPDNQSIWIAKKKNIGLAHARLSIIDLSTGNQPLSNSKNNVFAVVNGELYDYEQIRQELINKSHTFKTLSDSEIIIHLYEEYGVRFVDFLKGEFSFILWDAKKEILFAWRDRFGIKPLYYSFWQNTFFIASEIKALYVAGVPIQWDENSKFYMDHFIPFQGLTNFKNIYSIKPGHYIKITNKEFKEIQYWDINFPPKNDSKIEMDNEVNIKNFRQALKIAVKRRTRADVPIGCYLSGGLDSTAILALLTENSSGPIRAFNISFEHKDYDEGKKADKVAKFFSANLTSINVSMQDICDNFSQSIWHNESPIFNTQGIAKFLLSKHVNQSGFKVILTGEGADEILGGYTYFRKDMITNNDPVTNENVQSALRCIDNANVLKTAAFLFSEQSNEALLNPIKNILGFVPSMFEAGAGYGNLHQQIYSDSFKKKFKNINPFIEFLSTINLKKLLMVDKLNQLLYFWSKSILPEIVLTFLSDRMEMAHSVEGRLPFLDHELVEMASRLPLNLKINGIIEKYALREAVRDIIPGWVYNAHKHPFTAPIGIDCSSEKRSPMYILINDIIHSSDFVLLPFFDKKKVINLFEKINTFNHIERAKFDPIFNRILSTYFIMKHFNIR